MALSCDPNALMADAAGFAGIPQGRRKSVMIYLLCVATGIPADPQALMDASKCYSCIPSGRSKAVMDALLALTLTA